MEWQVKAVVSVVAIGHELALSLAEVTSMISVKDLWDRFHLAQEQNNADAALCFRHAIEAATRADSVSAHWWQSQGETCVSVPAG
jgi:hypothetical protein